VLTAEFVCFLEPNPDPPFSSHVLFTTVACPFTQRTVCSTGFMVYFSKCKNKLQARWWILMYMWCFLQLLSSVTSKLTNTCPVNLRLQSPLPTVFALPWWWWFYLIIIFILVWFLCLQHIYQIIITDEFRFSVFIRKISCVSLGTYVIWISWVIIALHCETNTEWLRCW
jgi:hypothetical protein